LLVNRVKKNIFIKSVYFEIIKNLILNVLMVDYRKWSRVLVAVLLCCCVTMAWAQRKKSKKKNNRRPVAQQAVEVVPSFFPLKTSINNRYFKDSYGRAFFMNADAGWTLFEKLTLADAKFYLQNRKSKRFNTIFVQLLPTEPQQTNAYGEGAFVTANDFGTPNEKYFEYVEQIIKEALNLRMAVAIAPAWLGCCGANWSEVQYQNGSDKCRQFGQYLGKRFEKYNNIVWIMGGGRDPLREETTQRAIAEGLKIETPEALITYHAAASHSSTDVLGSEPWLDFSMIHTPPKSQGRVLMDTSQVYESAQNEYKKTRIKPFVLGQAQYEDQSTGTSLLMRQQAYWTLLSGGSGHCYGGSASTFDDDWKNLITKQLPGATDMATFYRTVVTLPWELLRPDFDNNIIAEGRGTYTQNDYASVATLPNNKLAVIYLPNSRAIKINMNNLAGSILRAIWIRPRTGKKTVGGTFEANGIKELTPPDMTDDWLLLIGNIGRR
jgi:Protein of unknown function (DUF4038)/Putative collagen-binding domain of a collagenase